jgi:chromosome partitioning protein
VIAYKELRALEAVINARRGEGVILPHTGHDPFNTEPERTPIISNYRVTVNDIVRDNDNVDVIVKIRQSSFMYVITFANPKGGSGKTTSAMLLAEQIAISGGRVAILDLDPNANILAWAQAREVEGRDVPFTVHARPQAEETVELIDNLSDEADYLIIDLEGSKDQIVTFALSRTDLCIIPLDGSPMEARQAAQAVRLVQTTANMIRAQINYALLFTRTNAAFQTTDERDVRQEMELNNIPTLPVRIAKRAPYTRIFRDGVLLSELPDIVTQEMQGKTASVSNKAMKQVTGAIENARDYAQTVIATLTKEQA